MTALLRSTSLRDAVLSRAWSSMRARESRIAGGGAYGTARQRAQIAFNLTVGSKQPLFGQNPERKHRRGLVRVRRAGGLCACESAPRVDRSRRTPEDPSAQGVVLGGDLVGREAQDAEQAVERRREVATLTDQPYVSAIGRTI